MAHFRVLLFYAACMALVMASDANEVPDSGKITVIEEKMGWIQSNQRLRHARAAGSDPDEVEAGSGDDGCDTNPCQNGGTCTSGGDSYSCSCDVGYSGDNCQIIGADDCASSTCQHGGSCIDGNNEYTCECAHGYGGDNCETVDCSAGSPCLHGGTCVPGTPDTCSCADRFTGVICGTLIEGGIVLVCGSSTMEVSIPANLLTGGMTGTDLRFAEADPQLDPDPVCLGKEEGGIIKFSTALTGCGTTVTENVTNEIYTNSIVNVNEDPGNTITRFYKVNIPLTCTYGRNARVGSEQYYVLSDYTIDKPLAMTGSYAFDFDIFTDDTYGTEVGTYPMTVALNDDIFFAATLDYTGDDLELSIQSCRATPTTSYEDPLNFVFINEGCPTDGESTVEHVNEKKIGVQTKALRFIDDTDNFVYIHCDLLVCDAAATDSVCSPNCSTSNRRRRDVSDSLKTKRFTRGPLRVVREAEKDSTLQQEAGTALNPSWVIAVAIVCGTVIITLAIAVVVLMVKMNKISDITRRDCIKE